MNFLKQTIIENFQSHAKTVINWAPSGQLTVITGATDSGKTAIIRALRWLCNNTPQGSDFIRVGCTFARVTNIYVSKDGEQYIAKVIRERSASKNQYKIIKPDVDGPIIFEGFGNAVPLEVQEITGISPVQIGDEKYNLNIADQLAGPFLGNSVSSPARAKVLGKMAGTEEIDHAGKQTGTDLLRRGQDEKDLITDLAALATSIQGYDYLPKMAEKITNLETLQKAIKVGEERREKLTELRGKFVLYSQAVSGCVLIINQLKNIDLAQSVIQAIEKTLEKSNLVRQAAIRLTAADAQIKCNADIIAGLAGIESAGAYIQVVDINRAKRAQLADLQTKFNFFMDKVTCSEVIANSLKVIPDAMELTDSLNITIDKRNKLGDLKEELAQKNQVLLFAKELLVKLADIDKVSSSLSGLQALFTKQEQLKTLSSKLAAVNHEIGDFKNTAIYWENRTNELEKAYQDSIISLEVCPTCGAKIDPLNIQHLGIAC